MYLGYQDNKIKFYTEEELPKEFYNLDKSEYTDDEYVLDGEEYVLKDEEWERRQAENERERLNELSMTRSDFFDGMIMAFGLDSKELRVIVENVLGSINITPVQIRVALNNYDNALNFYRKHTLFTLINNVQIPINETMYLLFTDEIWDKFFDTKDYTELQKAIHEVEPEPEEEPIEDNIEESEGL
jgi:hypothetical protein